MTGHLSRTTDKSDILPDFPANPAVAPVRETDKSGSSSDPWDILRADYMPTSTLRDLGKLTSVRPFPISRRGIPIPNFLK